ncbi:hypothetical protein COT72_05280 [archaeon CG10_big_fil_rev_8_21_14_0_10_43_11]|nr:MAG: hypothetical protein COT72_05280 [archaeon CG10_big_fil_rev_8_21_14_0_10_43_11]
MKKEKGMSLEACVERAQEYITEQGACLLIFDVKNSRAHDDLNALYKTVDAFRADVNKTFKAYLPKNVLSTLVREETGFEMRWGDASWAAINNPQVILDIIAYQKKEYPLLELHWAIAKDGFDPAADTILS